MNKSAYLKAKAELRAASQAYYLGEDLEMDDSDYDTLNRAVEATEALHPAWVEGDSVVAVAAGAQVGGDVAHSEALLSLDNAMDEVELATWFERLGEARGTALVVEPKLDGLAVAARYVRGHLTQVITRGDGLHGEDVTRRGREASGLAGELGEAIDVELRGEIYMSDADFEEANEIRVSHGKNAFVNNRNGAAGALRNEKANYALPLSFACYDAKGIEGPHSQVMERVAGWGVATAGERAGISGTYTTLEDVVVQIRELGTRRSTLGLPTDGAVVKVDGPAIRTQLGVTSRSPRWAIAYKYPPEERFTTLLEVEALLGRTGVVTPRARVTPVFVGGVEVEYATMHNWIMVAERDWRIGDTVSVRRAGEVIPELVGVVLSKRPQGAEPITAPTTCPRCGSALDKSEKRWRCSRGRQCGLVESLAYAVSRDALDIEGLGEKLLTQLVEAGLVGDVADLFDLTPKQLEGLDRMGSTSAANVVAEIAKSREQNRGRWFTALGIRGTGRSLSRRLAGVIPSLAALKDVDIATLEGVAGIGSEKSVLIKSEIEDQAEVIDKLTQRGITAEDPAGDAATATSTTVTRALEGLSVVVTGSMTGVFAGKSRNEMNELIEAAGGRASSSVSKNTGLLVIGEGGGSKATKAAELGVRSINEAEFAVLVGA